jgi:hypothetical protein
MSILLAAFSLSRASPPPVPDVSDLTDPLLSIVSPSGGNTPIVSVRFNSNGDIEEATGDSGAALSYSKVGTWLTNITGLDGSEWEINFTVDSEDNGDPGTWTGATRGSYIDISTNRVYTWEKDANDVGTANSEVTCTIREIADTGNSDSRSSLSYDAQISA